jgi:propanol-preferring alcohol dehydrogenase
VIQAAVHWGCEVYVFSRTPEHRAHARRLGAVWAGAVPDRPDVGLDASVMFAPAGGLVPPALEALERGGTLALAGIHLSDIPALAYRRYLYWERTVTSVANATRDDGRDLLRLAAEIPIRTDVRTFPLREANRALKLVKDSEVRGAAVLRVAGPGKA